MAGAHVNRPRGSAVGKWEGGCPDKADTVVSLCWRHCSSERVERVCVIGTGLSPRAIESAGRGETFKSLHKSPVFMRFIDLLSMPMADRETANVRRLFLQALSEALFDCVNQSFFALRARTLFDRLDLIYKL